MKNRNDEEHVKNNYEDIENDYINFNDIITPNLSIGIRPCETNLKERKMRSQINHFK